MDHQNENNFERDEDLLSMMKRWEQQAGIGTPVHTAPLQPAQMQSVQPQPTYYTREAAVPEEPAQAYLSPEEFQGFQSAFAQAQILSPTQVLSPAAPPPPYVPPQVIEAADRTLTESQDNTEGLPHLMEQQPTPDRKQVKQMKNNRNKRKKRPVKRFFSWILALVLVVTGTLFIAAFAFAGMLGDGDNLPSSGVHAPRMGVTNILVIGVDDEAAKNGDVGRSDTILLLSIDRTRGKLKLASFLRDSWLQQPNGRTDRLNASFHSGGPSLLAQTISQNFDVRIDHYVQLNFTAFEALIDAVGGISVPVTPEEAVFLCNTTRLGKQIGRDEMRRQMNEDGAVKMTGEQALIYSRIRKLDSDFKRTERQRKVFGIVAKKMLGNPLSLIFKANKVLPHIKTDMGRLSVAGLATALPVYLTFDIEQMHVPVDGSWQNVKRNGADVITLDISKNTQALRDFIYG